MDPEIRRLLEENHALAKDTHRLLRAMRRGQLYSLFFKIALWFILLGGIGYLYQFYVKPLAESFSAPSSETSYSGYFGQSSAQLQKLLDFYKAGQ